MPIEPGAAVDSSHLPPALSANTAQAPPIDPLSPPPRHPLTPATEFVNHTASVIEHREDGVREDGVGARAKQVEQATYVIIDGDGAPKGSGAWRYDDAAGSGLTVYLEWPRPSRDFALPNHRSLEAMLTVYPNARFRCLIFAPTYALNYKYADALSVQHFQKYKKRGYDVAFELMHSESHRKLWKRRTAHKLEHEARNKAEGDGLASRRPATRHNESATLAAAAEERRRHSPGLAYFERWSHGYVSAGVSFILFKTTAHSVPPFELRMFACLARLWETGGILSDYTTLLQRPLHARGLDLSPSVRTAAAVGAMADEEAVGRGGFFRRLVSGGSSWWGANPSGNPASKPTASAATGRTRQRPHPRRAPPRVAVGRMEGIGALGAAKLEAEAARGCGGGYLASFAARDPVLRCLLQAYDSDLETLCDVDCLRARLKSCAPSSAASASSASSSPPSAVASASSSVVAGPSSVAPPHLVEWRSDLVDWRGCISSAPPPSSSSLPSSSSSPLSPPSSPSFPSPSSMQWPALDHPAVPAVELPAAVWLGLDATSGLWRQTQSFNHIPDLRPRRWHPLLAPPPRHAAPPAREEASGGAVCPEELRERWRQCVPFAPMGGTAKEEGAEDAKGAAEMRCAPSIFLPGAMKAASTFLFNAIAAHPQVLRPLEGAGFKEAGAYSSKNNRGQGADELGTAKAHRFPFIDAPFQEENRPRTPGETKAEALRGENQGTESGQVEAQAIGRGYDPFVSADGTVTYLSERAAIPWLIQADNPFAVAVVALREPVDRTFSDYRYLKHHYVPVKVGFAKATLKSARLWGAGDCLGGPVLATSLAAALETDASDGGRGGLYPSDHFYHTTCGSVPADPNDLVKKSLYFYMVRHWRASFGATKVMVVDTWDFRDEQRARATYARVLRFLQLCPYSIPASFLAHRANANKRTPNESGRSGGGSGGGAGRGGTLPVGLGMDRNTYRALGVAFEPFDAALFEMLGRDLGWAQRRKVALAAMAPNTASNETGKRQG